MGRSKIPSLDPFLDICSDIDFVDNENFSQVEFTCTKLVNPLELRPEDTDSESDSNWEHICWEQDTHEDLKMHLAFFKIKRYPQHYLLLLVFNICLIYFLSSYFL